MEIKDDSGFAGGTNGVVGATDAGFESRGVVVAAGLMTGVGEAGAIFCDAKFTCGGGTEFVATDPSEGNWTPQYPGCRCVNSTST